MPNESGHLPFLEVSSSGEFAGIVLLETQSKNQEIRVRLHSQPEASREF